MYEIGIIIGSTLGLIAVSWLTIIDIKKKLAEQAKKEAKKNG